ncbi:MAG: glycosyltransferase family 39 protein [Acidobacteriota bacterium]|nr:glycosyltransferase family 39 protein [Acidobacteriota bacterium]
MAEALEHRDRPTGRAAAFGIRSLRRGELIVVLFATLIYLTSLLSPPRLMDDVDAVQAQIARNMLQSGDWVTAHLDGVKYLEKSPLKYWMIAVCFKIFGAHDWAARLPISLATILLCWLVARMAGWALGARAGLYAGLTLATCLGLWLFTRVLIPDVVLTLAMAWTMWSFFRALEDEESEPHWRWWALSAWAAIGCGILLKGLIAAVFPLGTAFFYLIFSGLWRERQTWRRLRIPAGLMVMFAIAAPWHILATLRNPPYFDFTMHSESGSYRGFFWFYFFNEHILRFLNLRYPRDYDTVPRGLFWLLHFAWFFPWSAFLIRAVKLQYRGPGRAAGLRLLALCWIGMVMGFFALSTTQEYYSMPAYPAFAILIGSAMDESGDRAWNWILRITGSVAGLGAIAIAGLLWASRSFPTPGDISQALAQNPGAYTLSLGHMGDLTLRSFAYLRAPLLIAGVAALVGFLGAWMWRGHKAVFAMAVMMVLFFQAARVALIAFDPYLGSYPLAQALNRAPPGRLILDDAYYEMSSVFFYTNRAALILNGRNNNLEYGSYSPDAPHVFIGDADFVERWRGTERWYVAAEDEKAGHLRDLVGADALHVVASSGGKSIYVNR